MKTLITACLCLFSLCSFGAVQIAMEVEYAGKVILPTVITNPGEVATITQDDLKIEVKANGVKGNRAVISFRVFQNSKGAERLLASPSISTLLGSPAEITQGIDKEGNDLRLKATATIVP